MAQPNTRTAYAVILLAPLQAPPPRATARPTGMCPNELAGAPADHKWPTNTTLAAPRAPLLRPDGAR
jgi:hypothetical protein